MDIQGVCVIHEGFSGHLNQSLGIAEEIQRRTGVLIHQAQIPPLSKLQRLARFKTSLLRIKSFSQEELVGWLKHAKGDAVLLSIKRWLAENNLLHENVLVISAGSKVSPYTYAYGKILQMRTATIMLSRHLPENLFDFVIIPEHKMYLLAHNQKDLQKKEHRIFSMMGAANRITKNALEAARKNFEKTYSAELSKDKWVILIGGESAHFRLSPQHVIPLLDRIWEKAEQKNAELYLTTSRRTGKHLEEIIYKRYATHPDTRLLWLASEETESPMLGLLGIADMVFCTEDSVSMIWETISAGKNITLIPCEPTETGMKIWVRKIRKKIGLLKNKPIIKAEMMRKKYEKLISNRWGKYLDYAGELTTPDFNETVLISDWILKNWKRE